VIAHAHSEEDIARTVDVVANALDVYGTALEEGVEPYLVGGPTRRVFG